MAGWAESELANAAMNRSCIREPFHVCGKAVYAAAMLEHFMPECFEMLMPKP